MKKTRGFEFESTYYEEEGDKTTHGRRKGP